MEATYELLIQRYIDDQVGRVQDFISPVLAASLRQNLVRLREDDRMHLAGIGQNARLLQNKEIRSDRIFWLDRKHQDPSEVAFFDLMDDFITYLNRTCYTGISGYEFHYALYEPGSFYKRHVDQFRQNEGRLFTFIVYLNEAWQQGDGGELCIYLPDGMQKIAPTGGSCAFFKSKDLEHEVLLSHKPRMSVTGWLKRG